MGKNDNNMNNNNEDKQAAVMTDDLASNNNNNVGSSSNSQQSSLSDISSSSSVHGPFGIDPLRYTEFLFSILLVWILYLLVPRGLRVTYCGAYPKRYAWSSRIKRKRKQQLFHSPAVGASLPHHYVTPPNQHSHLSSNFSVAENTIVSVDPFHIGDINHAVTAKTNNRKEQQLKHGNRDLLDINTQEEEIVSFPSSNTHTHPVGLPRPSPSAYTANDLLSTSAPLPPLSTKSGRSTPTALSIPAVQSNPTFTTSVIYPSNASTVAFHDEIAISTTMQRLRDMGVLVMAHGSKGKPKSVRLSLRESAIVWRTEIVKKATSNEKEKVKIGKEHQVPLTDILYVDVGKQTTALRRIENISIEESLCFSLLTKEGSLDLETSSMEERDALVSCFSMILDEVHKNIGGEQGSWRDLYRAPSSDLPSSFDEYDVPIGGGVGTGAFVDGNTTTITTTRGGLLDI